MWVLNNYWRSKIADIKNKLYLSLTLCVRERNFLCLSNSDLEIKNKYFLSLTLSVSDRNIFSMVLSLHTYTLVVTVKINVQYQNEGSNKNGENHNIYVSDT